MVLVQDAHGRSEFQALKYSPDTQVLTFLSLVTGFRQHAVLKF